VVSGVDRDEEMLGGGIDGGVRLGVGGVGVSVGGGGSVGGGSDGEGSVGGGVGGGGSVGGGVTCGGGVTVGGGDVVGGGGGLCCGGGGGLCCGGGELTLGTGGGGCRGGGELDRAGLGGAIAVDAGGPGNGPPAPVGVCPEVAVPGAGKIAAGVPAPWSCVSPTVGGSPVPPLSPAAEPWLADCGNAPAALPVVVAVGRAPERVAAGAGDEGSWPTPPAARAGCPAARGAGGCVPQTRRTTPAAAASTMLAPMSTRPTRGRPCVWIPRAIFPPRWAQAG